MALGFARILLALSCLLPGAAWAQLVVTPNGTGGVTPTTMTNSLLAGGAGITVTDITYTGASAAAGQFSGGTGIVGFASGIVLTSGAASNVIGPNVVSNKGTNNALPGDGALTTLSGVATNDATILAITFTPSGNQVQFSYTFASDEYPEFSGGTVNDVFAFFVNGVNYALIPASAQPVTINNVNCGLSGTDLAGPNCSLYINNAVGVNARNTEMDGLTQVFSFTAPVTPNASNTLRLAIADGGDYAYDSAVFIAAGTFTDQTPATLAFTQASQSVAENAGTAAVSVKRTGSVSGAVSVQYATSNGTAVAGTNFTAVSGTLNWASNDSANKTFNVPILDDGAAAGNKGFSLSLSTPGGGAVLGSPASQTITINDSGAGTWPANCALPTGFVTPAGATAAWSVSSDSAAEGPCSLRSNTIYAPIPPAVARAQVEYSGSFAGGNVSFARRVSSKAGYDCLRFTIDGVQQAIGSSCSVTGGLGASGEVAWSDVSVPIGAGNHALRWSFERADGTGAGDNRAWIDKLVLPLAGGNVVFANSFE